MTVYRYNDEGELVVLRSDELHQKQPKRRKTAKNDEKQREVKENDEK